MTDAKEIQEFNNNFNTGGMLGIVPEEPQVLEHDEFLEQQEEQPVNTAVDDGEGF